MNVLDFVTNRPGWQHPDAAGGAAPVYGMAASLPVRGVLDDLLKRYLGLLYKV